MANGRPQGQQLNRGANQQRQGGNQPQNRGKKDEDQLRKDYKQVWTDNLFSEILKENKQDYNRYIDTVKSYVKSRTEVSASQLRNIYSEVLKKDSVQGLYALRPKLAYAAGRADKDDVKEVMLLMDDLIKEVKDASQLKAFKDFFEAVIAYHKFYGGKS